MSSNPFQLLPGTKIVLHDERSIRGLLLVDVFTLGRALGYKGADRLRRQILTEWTRKGFLKLERDYVSHEGPWVWRNFDHYVVSVEGHRGGGVEREWQVPADWHDAPLLFLTEQGMTRVLGRTVQPSKMTVETAWRVWLDSRPAPEIDLPNLPIEERRFRHEVMRGLFQDLLNSRQMTHPLQLDLRRFAIEIAEDALDEDLPEVRERFLPKLPEVAGADPTPSRPTTIAPVVPAPVLPLFMEEGYYTLTEIGEMAGGYSAATAGMAANAVGATHRLSPAQLRQRELPFNQVKTVEIKGRDRTVVRFNRDFSNKIVVELRYGPQYKPQPVKAVVRVTGFGDTRGRVDLRTPPLSASDF